MYLCEALYYQSSNNLPQTAQTLDFLPMVKITIKMCIKEDDCVNIKTNVETNDMYARRWCKSS